MNTITAFLIGIIATVGGWFGGDKPVEPVLAGFGDPFISIQLATSPSNGYILSTDGTNNSWIADAGGTGGTGTISTSTIPTIGHLPYWTSAGYPSLLGSVATGTVTCSGTTSCGAGSYVIGSNLTITGSAGGSDFAWTSLPWGNATSTTLGFLNGFLSTASSTISSSFYLPSLSQGLAYIGSGGKVNSIASSSVALSWFNNDAGFITSAGSGTVSTSTNEIAGRIPYWTSNSATPALLGQVATGTVSSGTGISVTAGQSVIGSGLTITNTSPDQTVVLSNGTGISTSGTYPNFTITNTAPLTFAYPFPSAATSTVLTFSNAPIFSSLTGILKGNGASAVGTASNGTDYTLIAATTCGGTDKVSAISASGAITCTADSGGTSAYEIATTSNIAVSGLSYFTKTSGMTTLGSVATSTLTATGLLNLTNTPSIIGSSGAVLTLPLAKGNFIVGDDLGVAQATSSIFISSTGNVGIGTTGPTNALDVAKGTGATARFYDQTPTTGATLVTIRQGAGQGTTHMLDFLDAAGSYVSFIDQNGYFNGTMVSSYFAAAVWLNGAVVANNMGYLFSSTNNAQGAVDVGISRLAAGKIAVGNGTVGDYTGTLIAGNVGIGTTTPGMKFAVQGDALADSWNVYSDIYKGDALTGLKGIKAKVGTTGNWVKVDHNTLPDGILKNTPQTYYEDYYKPILKEISVEGRMLGGLATTTETTGYKKISDNTIISTSTYSQLPEAQKGTNHTYTLQTMSISGLAQMNTRAIQQLDERLLKLEVVKLGSINSQGDFDKEQLKQEIINELKPDIQQMVDEAIDRKINSMSFVEKLKLLFK